VLMIPNYDIRGNLTPNEIIPMEWDNFVQHFVIDKPNSRTRQQILSNFAAFIEQLHGTICPNFKIWVDGSFVSTKQNPGDIDAVFLLPHDVWERKKSVLEHQIFIKEFKFSKGLDLYYFADYPENHKRHFLSHLDHLYWQDVYGHTKPDGYRQQFDKGFIELKIDSSWKK
jgi:hypothetical protein